MAVVLVVKRTVKEPEEKRREGQLLSVPPEEGQELGNKEQLDAVQGREVSEKQPCHCFSISGTQLMALQQAEMVVQKNLPPFCIINYLRSYGIGKHR